MGIKYKLDEKYYNPNLEINKYQEIKWLMGCTRLSEQAYKYFCVNNCSENKIVWISHEISNILE